MFKRILVPVDGSELSRGVAPYVRDIARALGAKITLLYVKGPEDAPKRGRGSTKVLSMFPEDVLRTMEASFQGEGVQLGTAVAEGQPAEAIVRFSSQDAYDLIAMATHGRSGLGRLVYGSVADRVLKMSQLPLLLCRPQREGRTPMSQQGVHSLLVPLDGTRASETALDVAAAIAKALSTTVTILEVVPVAPVVASRGPAAASAPNSIPELQAQASKYLAEHQKMLADRGVSSEGKVMVGSAPVQIIQAAGEMDGALIVMYTRGLTGMGRLVLGSVADRVLRESSHPVLIVRPQALATTAERQFVEEMERFRIVKRVYHAPPYETSWHEYQAFDGQEMVGRISSFEVPIGSKECWINDLWVDPKRRGQGLGNELLKVTIDNARSRGYEVLLGELTPYDTASAPVVNRLYSEAGFEVVEDWEGTGRTVAVLFP